MLQKLSQQVTDCHRHAREAGEQAEHAVNEAERLDYLAMERRWLLLAESYELVQRLSNFSSEAKKHAAAFFSSQSNPAAARVCCPACGKQMPWTGTRQPRLHSGAGRSYFECETCDVTALRAGPTAG